MFILLICPANGQTDIIVGKGVIASVIKRRGCRRMLFPARMLAVQAGQKKSAKKSFFSLIWEEVVL